MAKTITFNELRKLKDSLPDGATHQIADKLNITVQTVRNYFGGSNYEFGKNAGVHIEPGPMAASWYSTTPLSTIWLSKSSRSRTRIEVTPQIHAAENFSPRDC